MWDGNMNGYDEMLEEYYEGRDILSQKDGDCEAYEFNAEKARRLTAENKERADKIKELIKRGEEKIKSACERGRRHSDIFAGYCFNNGEPEYKEVIEHFRGLGYNIKYIYGTNIFEVSW